MLHAMRVHQWSKNLLVFVPLISSQHYNLAAVLAAGAAFFAFSFTASSAYVLNDIVDRETDRHHPAKRHRPFARGDVPVAAGVAMILVFLAIGFAIAFASSWRLAAILAIYLIGTVSYSLFLKRKMLIDVIALAGFYTLRVFGGAVAIAVPVSQWLIIFSIFIFFALAIVKRYSEISIWLETGQTKLIDRDYSGADLPALLALAAAASVSAVVVFALYVQSEAVRGLYSNPETLLVICPILIFWLSRLIILAHRRVLPHDPILFAFGDWVSWLTVALAVAVILSAI